jgi:hypothetical protein
MADEPAVPVVDGRNADASNAGAKGRTKDEVALELMKFVAVTTGYGKGATSGTGFSGKPTKSSEEYADALIQLFDRCRAVLAREPGK